MDNVEYVRNGQQVFCTKCAEKRESTRVERPCSTPDCTRSVVYSEFELNIEGKTAPSMCSSCASEACWILVTPRPET